MKILISLVSFKHLTGAELYVYELSKSLTEQGHEVLITAPEVGGEVAERARKAGALIYPFNECPSSWNPDVLHVNEYMPSVFAVTLYPDTPVVATVHSQFNVEKPFITDRVYKYICIRPEIEQKLLSDTTITADRTTVIYNGVDFNRFRPATESNKYAEKHVLFVGTIDPLRKKAILDLISDGERNNYKVTIVGKKHDTYLDNPPKHVTVYPPVWNVEKYFKGVTETAGILLGRTTIEGWAANLPGWIYDIDLEGNIKSKKLFPPPKDLAKFDLKNVSAQILGLYKEAVKNKAVSFDDISLNEARASVIANSLINEVKINILRGDVDSSKELINYLGAENYARHIKIQELEATLGFAADRITRLEAEVNILQRAILRRVARKTRNISRSFVNKLSKKG